MFQSHCEIGLLAKRYLRISCDDRFAAKFCEMKALISPQLVVQHDRGTIIMFIIP